jgi:hypothetical protein
MRRSILARVVAVVYCADRQEPSEALQTKTNRLKERIETLKQQMRRVERLKVEMLATPDQISLTDPDAPSMATSGRGSGVVGYNVQIAVQANHHLIVMHHEVRVKDLDSHAMKALLVSRALLVKIKRDIENQIRGLLKNLGLVIGRARMNVFAVRGAGRCSASSAQDSRGCRATDCGPRPQVAAVGPQ